MITLISRLVCWCLLAVPAQAAMAPKPWGVVLNSKYQFSLHESGDARKNSSSISTLALKYSFGPQFKIQGVVGGIQAIQPSLDFRAINPELRGFYFFSESGSKIQVAVGPTLNLPFGSDARDESLIVGAGLGGRISLNGTDEEGVGFNAYYDLTFNRNFHQFDTSVYAEVNNQHSLNHTLYAEYNFNSQWCLNTSLSFSSLWNYFGVLSNNYSVDQEIDYSANSYLTLFVSHVRGGDFLAPNGQNYSFGLFDPNSSRVSIGLTLSI